MKKEITNLDLFFLMEELKNLIGGRIRKVYQKEKTLRIEVYGGEKYQLLISPGKVYFTETEKDVPLVPPNFCMLLRKYLTNRIIREIKQYKFDRILQIHTDEYILIVEVFSGNVILCDSFYNIIMPLEIQRWKDRSLVPKELYKYPPSNPDPIKMDLATFRNLFTAQEIVKSLAIIFGGTYAEEICARAKLGKKRKGSHLKEKHVLTLYKAMQSLFTSQKKPQIIFKRKKPDNVLPITLKVYKRRKNKKYFPTFSQALDEFFKEEKPKVKEKIKKKIKRIKKKQKEAIEVLGKKEIEARKRADLIYKNYLLVQGILKGLTKARRSGLPWSEIKKIIESNDSPEAKAIKEIRENQGIVVLSLEGESIELDFTKSLEENAARFYETGKKAKRKRESAKKHLEIEPKLEEVKPEIKPVKKKKVEKERWFEKFRWFVSSDGFLAVGGKDADQNEMIIKKHTEPEDIVLHADIHGAPFVVVKAHKEATPVSIREAGEFAAAYSSAWKHGYGSVDVYWVRPDQVSKEAPSGQYLAKGSFMIKGRKNYLKKIELKISIGIRIQRNQWKILSGPTQSLRKHANYFVTLKPGETENLVKKIKNKILEKSAPEHEKIIEKIPENKFQAFIPYGTGFLIS